MYADKVNAIWLSVDPIEGAMKLSGIENNHQLGVAAYEILKVMADQHLEMNRTVIIDAVNPVEEARDLWRQLAGKYKISLELVECVTKDTELHKRRVEKRIRNIPGMKEIDWETVQFRKSEYQPWHDARIIIHTDGTIQESFRNLLAKLPSKSDSILS